jgi:hypothetical protein
MALSRSAVPVRNRSHIQIEARQDLEAQKWRVRVGAQGGYHLSQTKRSGTGLNPVQDHTNLVLEKVAFSTVMRNEYISRRRIVMFTLEARQ